MRSEVMITWNGEDVKRRAQSLIGKSAFTIGLAVLSDAKQLCPVNYGYLAASLMVSGARRETKLGMPSLNASKYTRIQKRAFRSSALLLAPQSFRKIKAPGVEYSGAQVFVGTAVEYGPYVEFGTVKSDAQPFLRPALDMARGKVPQIVQIGAKLEFAGYMK